MVTGTGGEDRWLPAPCTHHGLSRDPFAGKTVCCLLLEVSGLSLGVLNGFEVLLAELWPPRQTFVFTCARDVLAVQAGDAGEGKGLHIELCLLSTMGERTTLSTASAEDGSLPHSPCNTQAGKRGGLSLLGLHP